MPRHFSTKLRLIINNACGPCDDGCVFAVPKVVDERAAAVSAGKARNVMEKETAARAAGDSATQEAVKNARQEQKKAADAAAAVSVRKASCSCAG